VPTVLEEMGHEKFRVTGIPEVSVAGEGAVQLPGVTPLGEQFRSMTVIVLPRIPI
jgi:hypothetical protein